MKWSKTISGGGFIFGLIAFGVSSQALLPANSNVSNEKVSTQILDFAVPAALKDEAKGLIHQKWPGVINACPGLLKYSASLTYLISPSTSAKRITDSGLGPVITTSINETSQNGLQIESSVESVLDVGEIAMGILAKGEGVIGAGEKS